MAITDFDLDRLAHETRSALSAYELELFTIARTKLVASGFTSTEALGRAPSIRFEGMPGFTVPENRPYSLRAELPVRVNGMDAGKVIVKGFLPGDGTGKSDIYKPSQVIIPESLVHEFGQERVIPTARENTVVEGFLPLITAQKDGSGPLFCTSLSYLVPEHFAPGRVSLKKGYLGSSPSIFDDVVFGHGKTRPNISLTVGSLGGVQRDQHAVYRERRNDDLEDELIQLGAFLAVRKDNPFKDSLTYVLSAFGVPAVKHQ